MAEANEKAFTIRLRGDVLERLLEDAAAAREKPTPFIERIIQERLESTSQPATAQRLEDIRTDLLANFEGELKLLRADIVSTTQLVLYELRSAVSDRPLTEEQKQKWKATVDPWIERLRRRP